VPEEEPPAEKPGAWTLSIRPAGWVRGVTR
jgi:hypothetical protein